MRVERLTVGPLDVNCYILWDDTSHEAIIIDPGAEPDRILDTVRNIGLTVKMIVNTHGHVDHTGANKEIKESLGCPILMHQDDLYLLNDDCGIPIAELIGASTSPAPIERLWMANSSGWARPQSRSFTHPATRRAVCAFLQTELSLQATRSLSPPLAEPTFQAVHTASF